jgi:hypothetical protein
LNCSTSCLAFNDSVSLNTVICCNLSHSRFTISRCNLSLTVYH